MVTTSPPRAPLSRQDAASGDPAREVAALHERFWWLMGQRQLGEASAAELQSEAADYLATYFDRLAAIELVK